MTFLDLSFRSAKLWVDNPTSKDIIVDYAKYGDIGRGIEKHIKNRFVEPITKYQVANVLRTLMGERPIPTNRFSIMNNNDSYLELAEESYLRYTNLATYTNKKTGEVHQLSETCTLNKAPFNSFQNSPIYSWEIIRKYLGHNEVYDKFISIMRSMLGDNVTETPFMVLPRATIVKHERYPEMVEFLKEIKRSGILEFMETGKSTTITGLSTTGASTLTFPTASGKATILSGDILVPVSDELIERLRNGKGFSTILDSGLILINGLRKNIYQWDLDDYLKISEISIEEK